MNWSEDNSDPIGDVRRCMDRMVAQAGMEPTMFHMSSRVRSELIYAIARENALRQELYFLPRFAYVRMYRIKRKLGRKRWKSLPLPERVRKLFIAAEREHGRIRYNRRHRNDYDFEYWER